MKYHEIVEFKDIEILNMWLKRNGQIDENNPIEIKKVYRSADKAYFVWYTYDEDKEIK